MSLSRNRLLSSVLLVFATKTEKKIYLSLFKRLKGVPRSPLIYGVANLKVWEAKVEGTPAVV